MKKSVKITAPIYFISESTASNVEFKITKELSNRVIATGILQRGNEVNRNKRKYATASLASEINSARTRELVSTGNFKGEAGHPITNDLARQSTIDPKLEQVLYTKLWMEGDEVHANFMGTNNDLGESFDKDLRMGQKPSFSMRGLGAMVAKEGFSLVPKVKLITYDRVYYPSHSGAYTLKTINESADVKYATESGNDMLAENYDLTFKIKNDRISDFIYEESPTVKTVYDMLFIEKNKPGVLSESGDKFIVKQDNTTYYIPVETYIRNEILDSFK